MKSQFLTSWPYSFGACAERAHHGGRVWWNKTVHLLATGRREEEKEDEKEKEDWREEEE